MEEYDREHPIGGAGLVKFQESRKSQQAKSQRLSSPYTLSYVQQILLCLWRGVVRLRADPSIFWIQLIGNGVLAIITGSIFYNLNETTDSFFPRGALLFFVVVMNAFGSVLEILLLYDQRPMVEKHDRYALYHPSAEAIASMLTDMPYKILNTITFNSPIYFMTNLRLEAGPFFYFLFISFLTTLVMSKIFRTIASVSRTLHVSSITPRFHQFPRISIIILTYTTASTRPSCSNPTGYHDIHRLRNSDKLHAGMAALD